MRARTLHCLPEGQRQPLTCLTISAWHPQHLSAKRCRLWGRTPCWIRNRRAFSSDMLTMCSYGGMSRSANLRLSGIASVAPKYLMPCLFLKALFWDTFFAKGFLSRLLLLNFTCRATFFPPLPMSLLRDSEAGAVNPPLGLCFGFQVLVLGELIGKPQQGQKWKETSIFSVL